MQRIYFDNAATTALDNEVLEAMLPFLTEQFGNPSSIYSYGRETRMAIEKTRKSVAKLLQAHPGEIFFTSGGTESTNTAINCAIRDLGCRRIITSPIEHHATLHSCEFVHQTQDISLDYVALLPDGHVDLQSLEKLLAADSQPTLVALMHANNEIGNLLDAEAVGALCEKYQAYFYCDTVQTVGHYPIDVKKMKAHFINAAAHKFNGPKGVGLLYVNEDIHIRPLILGGGQERNMRAGTENVYGIIGFGKALELATTHYETHRNHIQDIKTYMATELKKHIETVTFNGDWDGRSLYTVLNVSFPHTEKSEMLLFNLDIAGICASGGSACSSGANTGSHVIAALHHQADQIPVRFSFSKNNTKEEVDTVVAKLKELL